MLLVLSLWALEFCLSFIEVLRGRLWSLFSILLRREQKKNRSGEIEAKKKFTIYEPLRSISGEWLRSVPRRHVVLGLGLAQLANSRGHPLGVEVPAAHLARSGPAVVGLGLLNRAETQ